MSKKTIIFFFFLICLIFVAVTYFKISGNDKVQKIKIDQPFVEKNKENYDNSNIIENVNYTSKDARGNEYNVKSSIGEIDYSDPDTIYLTNVEAFIKLANSNNIKITSNFGKYNNINFDTIFSKNVIIKYLDNTITGDYLEFSIEKNTMIISKNVIYTNSNNILKSDVVEIDIETKDTKIFMYEKKKKVNIKNK
jgi:hypothetical protein